MIHQSLLSALLAAVLAAAPAAAQTPTPQAPALSRSATADGTLLSVSAQAEATRIPDVATLSAGVVTQAPDANAALRANAAQMQQLMAAVRKAGIAEKDTQTSGLNVHPQYRHDGDRAPTITGYQATNTVSLKVRDIGKLGDVIDALVASGANQVHGPGFEIDQPEEAYDEARRAALAKARERAGMYAASLGLRVRRIVSISEGGGFMPPPMPMMRMQQESMDMMASSPVAPGESTLTANLDVVFELGN